MRRIEAEGHPNHFYWFLVKHGSRKKQQASLLYIYTHLGCKQDKISPYTSYTKGRTSLALLTSLTQSNSVFWAFISKNMLWLGWPSVSSRLM